MNILSPNLGLKVAAICVLSLGWSPLSAQTEPAPVTPAQPPHTSRTIVQKDYDELRHAVGSVKPEELPALQQKAAAGDLQSQLILGMLYQLGCGIVKHDDSTELLWYHKAADQVSPIAENQIGTYYDLGKGHDQAEGLKWYRKAADHGDAVAQNNVAIMYASGLGVKADMAEAVSWFRKAIENGANRDLPDLIYLYDSGRAIPTKSLNENQVEGLAFLRSLVNRGNPVAQTVLAGVYKSGKLGLTPDLTQAMNWLRKAAEKDPDAEAFLGWAYSHGEGVPNNDDEAVNWYRKSAEHGSAMGQSNLAFMYENGRGVHKELAEATKWVQAAAAQNDGGAQFRLAEMYEDGQGMPKDKITAIMWFILAKQAGAPDFMRELHPTTKYSGFAFYRHPSKRDYEDAQRRATAWRLQYDCR
ncbi:MAG TPA: tetratricopeptide repeat protein [Candidatus Binatia bacterium]|nr:tetratricopeptide repeat protein [Candidatus Binatia bacterium]